MLIANVQNICNLIGREEYNIGRIVLSDSILYSLTKTTTFNNIRKLLIKNKLMFNTQFKIILYIINKVINYH